MSIINIRFRMEGDLCVLQVLDQDEGDRYYGNTPRANWRDAKDTDLLVVAKFTSDYASLERRVQQLSDAVADVVNTKWTAQ